MCESTVMRKHTAMKHPLEGAVVLEQPAVKSARAAAAAAAVPERADHRALQYRLGARADRAPAALCRRNTSRRSTTSADRRRGHPEVRAAVRHRPRPHHLEHPARRPQTCVPAAQAVAQLAIKAPVITPDFRTGWGRVGTVTPRMRNIRERGRARRSRTCGIRRSQFLARHAGLSVSGRPRWGWRRGRSPCCWAGRGTGTVRPGPGSA